MGLRHFVKQRRIEIVLLTYLLTDRERGEWNERGRDAREREERGGKRRKERREGKGWKKSKNTPSVNSCVRLCALQ